MSRFPVRLAISVAALTVVTALAFEGAALASDRDRPRNQITVIADDHGYRIKGKLTAGPATIDVRNEGHEAHVADFFRLVPGTTLDQVLAAAKSDDPSVLAKLQADGGPGNGIPNLLSPGQQAETVGDGFQAGTYLIADGLPGADGTPHFFTGYAAIIQVGANDHPSPAPTARGDVVVSDTGVTLPPAISSGHGTFSVHYTGNREHEFQLVRLRRGATVQQAFDYWMGVFGGQKPAGPPPGDLVGGLGDLRPGVHGWVNLDLPAGTYGVWSVSDGDPTDVQNGVITTFTVH